MNGVTVDVHEASPFCFSLMDRFYRLSDISKLFESLWAELQTYVYAMMRHYAVYVFLKLFSIMFFDQPAGRLAALEGAPPKR